MSDETYRPFYNIDAEFTLGKTSTGNLRALDELRIRSVSNDLSDKIEICNRWCWFEEGDEGKITRTVQGVKRVYDEYIPTSKADGLIGEDAYMLKTALTLFEMSEEERGEANTDDLDFAEVRRALGNFVSAGNERAEGLISGFQALQALLGSENQTPNSQSNLNISKR